MSKLVFIVGTGRSGTHLIGRTISSHADVKGRIEDPTTFNLVTQIASRQDWDQGMGLWLKRVMLVWLYRFVTLFSKKPIVLEKSHPSLWLAEFFMKKIKDVQFIAIYRDVEPTVSSMLNHKGVLSWYKKLPQNKANRFLGIEKHNEATFAALPLEEKCALRWLSHRREIIRLEKAYPERFMSVTFDDFLLNSEASLKKLSTFLKIDNVFHPEEFRTDALDKWKTGLTEAQIEQVRAVVKGKL